jgi:uncharacterized protein (TIGR02117 family)
MSRAAEKRHRIAVLVAVAIVTGAAGCGVAGNATSWTAGTETTNDVWVIRHSWHTCIAVRRADVDPAVWPESRDVGDAAFLEVGWGDRDFYSKPRPSVWDAIDPVIRATPAALHVGAFDTPAAELVPGTAVVHLRVPAAGFERMTRFIQDEYVLDGAGTPVRMGRGFYERSWFYQARSRYHVIFSNSNSWVANALRAGGLPMKPGVALTAEDVIAQASAISAHPLPR